jgi:geranylgeranyl reductase family protein
MAAEQEHDVIVVGAGPAGATTATILAQMGYDVLLLDRNDFPRDKACGDGVPAGAWRRLYRLGIKDKADQALARGEMYPIKGMRLVSPRGHVIEADFREEDDLLSYVMPRIYFDALIQRHAVDSGAHFQIAAVKEPLLEDGRVAGVNAQVNGSVKPIRGKVVVGADGATSVIARSLRPSSKQHHDAHRAIAVRAYIHDLQIYPGEVEFFLYDEILPGYSWIFPTGNNQANIGLGMRLDCFREMHADLNVLLQKFLDLPQIEGRVLRGGEVDKVRAWQLNFGSQKNLQYAYDGALLVGDAAGLINPVTGGGIHNALISAELAAQTIDEALAAGNTARAQLKVYERRLHDALWASMRRSYWFQRLLLRFPNLVDFLVVRAQSDGSIVRTFLDKL